MRREKKGLDAWIFIQSLSKRAVKKVNKRKNKDEKIEEGSEKLNNRKNKGEKIEKNSEKDKQEEE